MCIYDYYCAFYDLSLLPCQWIEGVPSYLYDRVSLAFSSREFDNDCPVSFGDLASWIISGSCASLSLFSVFRVLRGLELALKFAGVISDVR